MKSASEQTAEIRGFLEQLPLFSNMGDESMRLLSSFSRFVDVEKGGLIFVQSDPSDKCYLVRSGLISIILESYDGREMVINEMRTGDLFGEVGLLTNKNRSTSSVARTECEILVIPGQTFLEVLENEPYLVRRLLELTANRLRSSSERESALAFLDAQARLARLLLQLERQEVKKGYITISQEDLALRTGLTRQTAAKVLGRWRRAGWLITGRGRILLLKHDRLTQLEKEWLDG
jgi:CRP-like cAMP-binding protein